jgi:hypothetical protein
MGIWLLNVLKKEELSELFPQAPRVSMLSPITMYEDGLVMFFTPKG